MKVEIAFWPLRDTLIGPPSASLAASAASSKTVKVASFLSTPMIATGRSDAVRESALSGARNVKASVSLLPSSLLQSSDGAAGSSTSSTSEWKLRSSSLGEASAVRFRGSYRSSKPPASRVPRSMPLAAAVLDYQKHRVKKLKKQGRR